MEDYTTATTDELLAALDRAGRTPSRALLEACLARRDELVPGLLERLEEGTVQGREEGWDNEDPRWYRDVHAGRLLIAFREEKALPVFEKVFRSDEEAEALEWFEGDFTHYGPAVIPMLTRLMQDASVPPSARNASVMMLKDVALRSPDTAPQVVDALRATLPALTDHGEPDVPEEVDEDQIVLFTFVALALGELGDTASQAQVEALHDWYLIDETIYGDYTDFLGLLDEEADLPKASFDLIETYRWEEGPEPALAEDIEVPDRHETNTLLGYGGEATYVRAEPKVGRNDPCPCGSGKKYKKCCGRH